MLDDIIVSIQCLTYNHAPYIRQCLDGFVMQKTNFRFEAIVHDDASTDGTTEIVREYASKYPDIIKPIYQVENQYSKGIVGYITDIVQKQCKGKYIAICEGDDYWTDPLKLQKQVDYMDKHPECTMTCCRAKLYSNKKGKFIGEQYCREYDGILNPVDIINRTGLYIPTCSLIYRPLIKNNYPDYCRNCNVGDYPLKISAAMKGTVYYFDNVMSVYRIQGNGSWSSRQKVNSINPERLHIVHSQKEMFKRFSIDYPQYGDVFMNKIAEHIIKNMPTSRRRKEIPIYLQGFSEYVERFSLKWKIVLFVFYFSSYIIPIPRSHYFFRRVLLKKYMLKKTMY